LVKTAEDPGEADDERQLEKETTRDELTVDLNAGGTGEVDDSRKQEMWYATD
jgi:hypothetical protein